MALLSVQEVFSGWRARRLKQWSPFWNVLLGILLDRTAFSRLHLLIGTICTVTAVWARNHNWLNMQDRRAVFATICMIACLLCVAIIFDTVWHLIMVHIAKLILLWWNICIHTSSVAVVSTHLVESRIIFHLICDKVAIWRVLLLIRWVVMCQYVLVTKLGSLIELILLVRIRDDHVIIWHSTFIWRYSLIIEHWSRLLEVVDWHHYLAALLLLSLYVVSVRCLHVSHLGCGSVLHIDEVILLDILFDWSGNTHNIGHAAWSIQALLVRRILGLLRMLILEAHLVILEVIDVKLGLSFWIAQGASFTIFLWYIFCLVLLWSTFWISFRGDLFLMFVVSLLLCHS